MKKELSIKFWGVRGSTPCANYDNMHFGGNTTCAQIVLPESNDLLIFDCGTGFRNLGNHLNALNKSHRGHVFLTHPHWDHLQGFPFFKPFYDSKNWFRIYLPPQQGMGCKDILQGHMSSTFFPVSIDMLEADLLCETIEPGPSGIKKIDDVKVSYMWASHTIPTAIFKIEVEDRIIIFAPDNEIMTDGSEESKRFEKEFRAFIHGADVLIHDAQFNEEEYKNKQGWGHSAWEEVVKVSREEKVRQLYLTHHDPDNNDVILREREKQIIADHGDAFDVINLAKEGQKVDLPLQKAKKIKAD